MDASLDENFHVYWKKDTQGAFPNKLQRIPKNRVLDKMVIDKKIQELLIRGKGRIKEVKRRKEKKMTVQNFMTSQNCKGMPTNDMDILHPSH